MGQITRNIDLDQARDLLEQAPRACLSYAGDDGPRVLPAVLIWRAERYLVGVSGSASPPPAAGQEVVLLVDEGVFFFDLRAVYIRGQAQPATAPAGAPAGLAWLEVVPLKTVAWDYGALREAPNE